MAPTHERLEAGDRLIGERNDRLVIEDELAAAERPSQVGLELQPGDDLIAHACIEQLDAGASGALGALECDVRITQHVFGTLDTPMPRAQPRC